MERKSETANLDKNECSNESAETPNPDRTFKSSRAEPILFITDDDVALGRGKHLYSHTGNVRFRKIVAEFAGPYMENESRAFRKAIALKIIEKVEKTGGRFLQPVQVKSARGEMETHWKGVSASFVNSKVTQSLRDTANSLQPPEPQTKLERLHQVRLQSARRIGAPRNPAVQSREVLQAPAIARRLPDMPRRILTSAAHVDRSLRDLRQPQFNSLEARLLLEGIQNERRRRAAVHRARGQMQARLLSTPSGRLMLSGVSPQALIAARINQSLRSSLMDGRKL